MLKNSDEFPHPLSHLLRWSCTALLQNRTATEYVDWLNLTLSPTVLPDKACIVLCNHHALKLKVTCKPGVGFKYFCPFAYPEKEHANSSRLKYCYNGTEKSYLQAILVLSTVVASPQSHECDSAACQSTYIYHSCSLLASCDYHLWHSGFQQAKSMKAGFT